MLSYCSLSSLHGTFWTSPAKICSTLDGLFGTLSNVTERSIFVQKKIEISVLEPEFKCVQQISSGSFLEHFWTTKSFDKIKKTTEIS